ncbi:MAG: substrate-binding domain-containing protein [Oscillospiraceae bacterium]|jgi:phosphate transport system substrate-binding protein|nr:substrate-binding domain-containing protein [Oscillospiraceae bacterium]
MKMSVFILKFLGLVALALGGFYLLLISAFIASAVPLPWAICLVIFDLTLILFVLACIFGWFRLKKRAAVLGIVTAACVLVIGVDIGVRAYEDSITITESTVSLGLYDPFEDGTLAASLDAPASLQITENLPRLDGATAFYPVYAAFVRAAYDRSAYINALNQYDVLTCTRTESAYERLFRGETDVIFAFAPTEEVRLHARDLYLDSEERESYAETEFEFTPIGREAFVFFVNGKNGVDDISSDDLRRIYSGEITNWNQVGGKNKPIRAFQRNENSGSQTALIEFMDGAPIMAPLSENVQTLMSGMVSVVSDYHNYSNSIGYSFLYYATEMVENDVKLLSVDGVAPTRENVENGTYPLIYDFYAVTAGTENPNAQSLIDWILSAEGQELVRRSGYTSIK